MTQQDRHRICTREKRKAMALYDAEDCPCRQDVAQAIIAFDELLGQLHKHNRVKPSQLAKTKDTALGIIGMISDPGYRERLATTITNL